MMIAKTETAREADESSIGELFTKLARDTGTLIRQEVRLVIAETRTNLNKATAGLAWLVSGALIAVAGACAMIAALILVLSLWLPPWAAAGVVAIGLCGLGFVLANYGWTTLKGSEYLPDDSIESIKEDTEWLKKQIKN